MAQAAAAHGAENGHTDKQFWALALGSIGVVYGDIGTSPLYALREAVNAAKSHGASGPEAVLGILSLMTWTLLLIVTLKYVHRAAQRRQQGRGRHLRADGARPVGGQAQRPADPGAWRGRRRLLLRRCRHHPGHLGAVRGGRPEARRPGDEGRGPAGHDRHPFGPVRRAIARHRRGRAVLRADHARLVRRARHRRPHSPHRRSAACSRRSIRCSAIQFVLAHGVIGLAVMGLVFLVATGAEALYADLGHFGRKPIQFAWLAIVQPALILNYFGQGALLLANPEAIENPFYRLYPSWALIPMVVLATMATVIASQAVITGAFSFTRQAIQLGLLPRLEIRHTSESVAGQIYLPRVNQLLFVGVLLVTLIFRSSSDLAAAYGLSVTATMVIDSLMAFFVVWRCWGWPVWKVAALMVPLLHDRAGIPGRQHHEDSRGRLASAGRGRDDQPHGADLGARLAQPGQGHAQERGGARMAGAQARCQAAASRAGNGRVPDRRSELGADLADAQPQAQPRAARAQHHPDHQDRGHAARAAPRAHPDRSRGRHLHPRDRALRLHGDAERAEDPRALPAQGPQHRHLPPPRSSCRGARSRPP